MRKSIFTNDVIVLISIRILVERPRSFMVRIVNRINQYVTETSKAQEDLLQRAKPRPQLVVNLSSNYVLIK